MVCPCSLTSFISSHSPPFPIFFCQIDLCISSNGPFSFFLCYLFLLRTCFHTPPPPILWLTPIPKFNNQNSLMSQVPSIALGCNRRNTSKMCLELQLRQHPRPYSSGGNGLSLLFSTLFYYRGYHAPLSPLVY